MVEGQRQINRLVKLSSDKATPARQQEVSPKVAHSFGPFNHPQESISSDGPRCLQSAPLLLPASQRGQDQRAVLSRVRERVGHGDRGARRTSLPGAFGGAPAAIPAAPACTWVTLLIFQSGRPRCHRPGPAAARITQTRGLIVPAVAINGMAHD